MAKITITLSEKDLTEILYNYYAKTLGESDLEVAFSAYENRSWNDQPTGGYTVNATVTTRN